MKLNAKKIRNDPIYFIQKVIGMKLTPYVIEWFQNIKAHKRITLMAFRTSGKTSQLFINYFIWNALVRPGTMYCVISKTLPQAREILKEIRTTILTTPLLKSMVPSNRTQAWSASEVEMANHSRILAKAYNGNVRGLHVDGVGCDEIGEYECFTETSLIAKSLYYLKSVSKFEYLLFL